MFRTEKEFARYINSLGGTAYLVGGAVRDEIIGRSMIDKDYVVTGIDQSQIPEWASVGKSFPVYLLKIAGQLCEVALARRERKTGPGHCGFEFEFNSSITIEQDLSRRDFTMNSIAKNILTGEIIDPSNGIEDIKNKVIRANTGAFVDDPLRVFRAARFAAQLELNVHNDTISLMWDSDDNLNELSPERVFGELAKALIGERPSQFFKILNFAECLGWNKGWFSELAMLDSVQAGTESSKHGPDSAFDHTMKVIDRCRTDKPEHKFACLCHDFGKALSENPPKHYGHENVGLPLVERFCDRLRVPNSYRKAAMCFTENHMRAHRLLEMRSGKAARLVYMIDKGFPGGIKAFLSCSIADGMEQDYAAEVYRRAKNVLAVRLPEKYRDRGVKCAEIMTNLRGEAWNM